MNTPSKSTRSVLANSSSGRNLRSTALGPGWTGTSGSCISSPCGASPGSARPLTGPALPSRGAKTRLAAISRAASSAAQRRGCFIADSFGDSPPCASAAPVHSARSRKKQNGPALTARGHQRRAGGMPRFGTRGVRPSGSRSRLPVNLSAVRLEPRLGAVKPHLPLVLPTFSPPPPVPPAPGLWVSWLKGGAKSEHRLGVPNETASPYGAGRLDPGLPACVSPPYFSGFLNRSSASSGLSLRLVTRASIIGLSSTTVFSLCGYWMPPTGLQSL